MSDEIPAAVVGVGYLGRFHAEKYAASPKSKLVAVVDIDADRAREVGHSVGAEGGSLFSRAVRPGAVCQHRGSDAAPSWHCAGIP